MFTPLIGGTTKDDIKTGNVANLKRNDYPGRTTIMKVSSLSTLWDYIHRAMPWNAPKTLSDDEVYAVLAYLLNLAEIVPDDFTLSDSNIKDVQKLMPNRNGMVRKHAMWPGKSGLVTATPPDTKNTACMTNCKPAAKVSSTLPDYAQTSHGELAPQFRPFGQTRGQALPVLRLQNRRIIRITRWLKNQAVWHVTASTRKLLAPASTKWLTSTRVKMRLASSSPRSRMVVQVYGVPCPCHRKLT